MSANERRPDPEIEAAGDRWAPTDQILRLRATVAVHLAGGREDGALDLDRLDRRALYRLAAVPNGARVAVHVGSRALLTLSAVHELHAAAGRLDVEIIATDPDVIRTWHRAITSGRLS
jgi:hypothetical protein